jgi:hypothetical protein
MVGRYPGRVGITDLGRIEFDPYEGNQLPQQRVQAKIKRCSNWPSGLAGIQ